MTKHNINFEDILLDHSSAEDIREVPLGDQVFKAIFGLSLIITGVIFIKVTHLNLIQGNFYREKSTGNMSDYKIQLAPRGVILDRFEKPLVHNEPSLQVFLVPRKLPTDSDERVRAFQKITSILGLSEESLRSQVEKTNWGRNDAIPLTNNLSHDTLVSIASQDIPGIAVEPIFKRVQDIPYAFSHILGYIGFVDGSDLERNSNLTASDQIGKTGLEAYYDSILRGKNGKEVSVVSAIGEIKEQWRASESEPGKNLKTFIDRDLQEYFYNRLLEQLRSLERTSGAGLAINPQNGEVLALVSVPGFDSSDIIRAIEDKREPLFNRVISGLYAPGSTIKPLHAIAALKEGIVNPESQVFSKAYITIPNPYNPNTPSKFLDWKPHGWVDVYAALAKSSNIYFYSVTGGIPPGTDILVDGKLRREGLGITRLRKWWEEFGLSVPTGIDLTGEKYGFLPSPEWKEEVKGQPWRIGDTYNVGIGQGDLLVTPLELLNYITAIANGGFLYRPRIAVSQEVQILKDIRDEVKNVLPYVRNGMRDGVIKSYGSSNLLASLPMSAAGKTGTAQVSGNTKTNAFFVGYAPLENPEIAILVLVENSREGSLNAVPVAKDVLLWYYERRIKK